MSSTITWVVVGIGVALAALLLFSGGTADVPVTAPSLPPSSAVPELGASAVGASAPVVDVGEDLVAGEREAVALDATGYDPAGGPVAYSWTSEGALGFFSNAHVANPVFTAPSACDCDDRVVLTLTVTNSRGISASDSLLLTVRDPLNCPQTCAEQPAPYIRPVDPCGSVENPCPEARTPCDGPCVSVVPPTGDCGQVPVPCRCETDCGPTWDAAWPGEPEPGHPRDRPKPRIDRRFPASIHEGGTAQIRAAIANPGCTSLCFSWSASKGWFENAESLDPIYHAPMSDRIGGERVTISLVIYDGYGGRSYDQIRIMIENLDG